MIIDSFSSLTFCSYLGENAVAARKKCSRKPKLIRIARATFVTRHVTLILIKRDVTAELHNFIFLLHADKHL